MPAGSTRKTARKGGGRRHGLGDSKITARPDARRPARKTQDGIVVGVGLATVDMLCVAPRLDERLMEMSMFSMQGGGSIGTALATIASLGAKTRYFGRLGDDDFGKFILLGLEALQVDTAFVAKERHKVSPLSVVQIDEGTRRRKILFTRGSVTPLDESEIPQRLLEGATMLCIDGHQPALQAAVAERARAKGITVVLNAGHLVGGMGELLALSDVVIASERFASEFAPSDDIETSLREMIRIGPRVAVITLGRDGAVGLEGEKVVRQEAVDVPIADTTGAGDVFCGAFTYALRERWPLERALPFANAAAALTCRNVGAQSSLPSLAEVTTAMERG